MLQFSPILQTSHRIEGLSTYKCTNVVPCHTIVKAGDRPRQRFFYILEGTAIFEFSGKSITAPAHTILYLPYDCAYQSYWINCETCAYIGINFTLYNSANDIINLSDEICIVTQDTSSKYFYLFDKLNEIWLSNVNQNFKCLQFFYDILENIQSETEKSLLKQKHDKIYKAIIFLEEYYMENTPIEELAKLCNMSLTSFRRTFKEEIGTSPVKYRNRLKMQKALEMLREMDYSISQISDLLNCSDVYHFSKLFKSEYGVAPSQIRKNL